jgi:pseudouridine synthase
MPDDLDGHGELRQDGERLQKVLAAAGIASRRASEDLMAAGRVAVNGRVVSEPGTRVDPAIDEVAVDGVPVRVDPKRRTVLLHKPTGVVSTMQDDRGRPDLTQYTDRYEERLFNVGRLDTDTSGLLLLTNDGDLAQVLSHPSFGVTKTYIALVEGAVKPPTLKRLKDGIELDDGPIAVDRVRILPGGAQPGATLVELTLHSGRNRIVRRMLDAVGHPVRELARREFGPLKLGDLPVGRTRELTAAEFGALATLARRARPSR